MKVSLKIPVVVINGEQRVLPEAFDVLIRFGEHRKLCSQCDLYFTKEIGFYCATGDELNKELFAVPGVELYQK